MRKIPLLIAAILVCFDLIAQDGRWTYKWSLDPDSREASADQPEALRSEQSFNGHNFLIVRFRDLPGEEQRAQLNQSGIELLGYLGDNHYWARIRSSSLTGELLQRQGITGLAVPDSELKHNALTDRLANTGNIEEFAIRLWNGDDLVDFAGWAVELPATSLVKVQYSRKIAVLQMPESQLDAILAHPSVAYAGPYARTGVPLLDDGINMVKVNALQNETAFGQGLSGLGVNIGMWDGGLTGNHVDFNARVTNVEKTFFSSTSSKHPSHVASILNGKGHSSVRIRGMAPDSKVFAWTFDGDIIGEMNEGIADHGLNIINSSFFINDYNDPITETMCVFPAFYVLESSEIDQMIRENPALTHVIANGNQHADCQGAGYWSGIPIGLQSAKNAINVGWLDLNEIFYGGSSVGPTYDGRLKPELVAKGARLIGGDVDHGYHERWGSSGSAPTTAGAIALLYQWYFDQYGSFPDAALAKAVMCNTAFDLFYTGPDYFFGFGRVNALRAQQAFQDTSYLQDAVSDGQVKTYVINVPAGTSLLNVLSAWSDKEAVPGTVETLVNDIDLKVIGPDMTEYLPWVLDPAIPFLGAVTGVDSVNNIEKVSVFNPAAGSYTIEVHGTEIPFGPQDFAVTYDMPETGIAITHPVGGEQWTQEVQFIRWDAFGTGNTFTIDISYNNGATWSNLGTKTSTSLVPATFFSWNVAATTSHEVRIRVSSGGYESVSGPFTIMRRVTAFFNTACDRHLKLAWRSVPAADDYIVQILENDEYIPLDTISDTTYLIGGLENGKEYWVAVTARDGENLALRSNGVRLVPNGSNCSLEDDIGAYYLCRPMGYRYTFDGSLPYSESLQVVIRNYSSDPASGFDVCYQRDGGAPVCEAYPGTLAANAIDTFTFAAIESFADTLAYDFRIYTEYGADTYSSNDTINARVRVVPSHPSPLPYSNDFEDVPAADYISKFFAIDGMEEWDFEGSSASGRMSVSRLEQFAHEGRGSFTLDRYIAGSQQSSCAILNLNFDGYQDSTIYLDLAYASHGEAAESGDRIWARADISEPWVEVFDFTSAISNSGYSELKAINLTDLLITDNGQAYGRNFQLKIGQEGSDAAFWINKFDGRSIDDISLYTVGEDISISGPGLPPFYCDSASGALPIQVTVTNNSLLDAVNVPVVYQASNGATQVDIIPLLPAGDSIVHDFSAGIPYSPGDVIDVDVFVAHPPDTYAGNDSVNGSRIVIQPFADISFYDDFESPNDDFHAGGTRSTWERGDPANIIISEAASGSVAWVTNLEGRYNNTEESYLVLPCFDLSDQASDVNVAFNLKLNIEANFDRMAFQYSEDGVNWQPLPENATSYNWFNDASGGNYWDIDVAEWKTTSTVLRLDSLDEAGSILFRIEMISDEFYKIEGIGVDDIHVIEDDGPVFAMTSGQTFTQPSLPVASSFSAWHESGALVASVSSNTDIDSTLIGVTREGGFIDVNGFRALPRHFWLAEDLSYRIRLYLPYEEYDDFFGEFPSWAAPSSMAVLAYKGPAIDGSAANNSSNYRCAPGLQVKPYRNGYILEFDHEGPGEFYIVESTPCSDVEYIDAGPVTATALDPDDGLVEWSTSAEINIAGFLIEGGPDSSSLDPLGFIAATGTDSTSTDYSFTDSTSEKACYMYYAVLAVTNSGDTLHIGADTASFIFPSLVAVDSLSAAIETNDDVTVTWGTLREKCNDRFDISVSINGGPFGNVGTVPSAGSSGNWMPYSFIDDITPKTDTLCYRIEQVFLDGSFQVTGPVCVIFADSALDISFIEVTDAVCNGSATGAIDITPAGGTPPYSYLWSNGESTQDISGIEAGQYTVTVEDAMGDTVSSPLIEVAEPPALILNGGVSSDALCAGTMTGSVTGISVSGGVQPYVYLWTDGSGDLDASGLSAGEHQLEVTDSNGCTALSEFFIIGEPSALELVSATALDVSCNGDSDGSIDISVDGGTAPYSYAWSNGDSTQNIDSLSAGEYSCTITDSNGCVLATPALTVEVPEALELSQVIVDAADCFGDSTGTIDISVTGGTAPFEYAWSNGDSTEEITGLAAGLYAVTIVDTNGCESVFSNIEVAQPDPVSQAGLLLTDVSCYEAADGAAEISLEGGTPPYLVIWDTGDTIEDIVGLEAGLYNYTVYDSNGCEFAFGPYAIEEPDALLPSAVIITDAACRGDSTGAVDLEMSGGTPPYQYNWTNGDTGPDLFNVPAGAYGVTVTDSNGCVFDTAGITVTEPAADLEASIETSPETSPGAADGSVTVTVTGGEAPYEFAWNTGDNTQNLAGVTGAEYCVAITDANDCEISECAVVELGTSVSGLVSITELILYPNPARHEARLVAGLNQPGELTVRLVDVEGRIIEEQSAMAGNSSEVEFIFDTSGLPSGAYVVHIKAGQGVISLPLVVQK